MQIAELWSAGLTLVFGITGFVLKERFNEINRLSILLNRTREEMARDMITRAEVTRLMEHMDGRFNKLEEKLDKLISAH
jgi:hypothetical protein